MLLPMLSGSMAPALLPGDVLTVRPASSANIHRGDIVVLRIGNKLIAHRLVFVTRLGRIVVLVEKGDANNAASFVDPGSVAGIVVSASRNGQVVMERSGTSRRQNRHAALRSLVGLLSLSSLRQLKRKAFHHDA